MWIIYEAPNLPLKMHLLPVFSWRGHSSLLPLPLNCWKGGPSQPAIDSPRTRPTKTEATGTLALYNVPASSQIFNLIIIINYAILEKMSFNQYRGTLYTLKGSNSTFPYTYSWLLGFLVNFAELFSGSLINTAWKNN